MSISMRWIAPSLVVVSLVFSTGGVAIMGRADSGADAKPAANQTGSTPAKISTQCSVPSKPRNSAATRRKRTAQIDSGKNTIVLNTSGYNYATEGQWQESPIGPPRGGADGALPKSAGPSPAEPASK